MRLELLRERSYLEQQNRKLRRQRSHVLDVAQSSKLQSLASLSAGVAHEINTPVGSIRANVDVMESAVRNLRRKLGDATNAKRALDALDELLPLTREAAGRVGIVDQLKQFARLDRALWGPVDLREGLESALALLRFRLAEKIDVVRDYDANVPLVAADAEHINQGRVSRHSAGVGPAGGSHTHCSRTEGLSTDKEGSQHLQFRKYNRP